MSTLRTSPVGVCPGGDALVSLLYDDFDPGAVPSRDDLEAHVRACATCLAEFEALGGVRAQLAAWTAPDVTLGFEVVRTSPRAPLGWRQTFAAWSARSARALPAAAAALVVLGGAMALARLDIRYDQAGLTVRTGWGHAASPSSPATGGDAAALMRSFRQALDESEVRQQQNLQLRIAEVTRDFDLQRRQDLVQVEQGFGRLDTQRQQMLDAIRRVSLGVPQQ